MATLYKVDGVLLTKEVEVKPKSGKNFSLVELQGFVEGYIELISLKDEQIMVVNKEGKLQDLPINRAALRILSQSYPGVKFGNVIIAGNAIICKSTEIE